MPKFQSVKLIINAHEFKTWKATYTEKTEVSWCSILNHFTSKCKCNLIITLSELFWIAHRCHRLVFPTTLSFSVFFYYLYICMFTEICTYTCSANAYTCSCTNTYKHNPNQPCHLSLKFSLLSPLLHFSVSTCTIFYSPFNPFDILCADIATAFFHFTLLN